MRGDWTEVLAGVLLGVGAIALSAPVAGAAPPRVKAGITAEQALQELREGNARFAGGRAVQPRRTPADFQAASEAQHPEAVIIACADSRVAPELLFDAGIGDLFVIRVAGNVVDGGGVLVKGSVEYAVSELDVPLVVVLGHTKCGAVKAAVEHIDHHDSLPGAINGLVELIKPVVVKVHGTPGDAYERVARENVAAGVAKLKSLEPIVGPRVKAGGVKVVGGIYELKSGKVEFLE